jgi:pimeloyl-ACP methyl ester carboxylesterase
MHILIISVVGGAATLLGLLTMRQYRRDLDAAYKQLENRSQVVTTQCGAIEYASEGSGLPVLVIHGNGGGFDQGLGLARGYLGQGFQIVAPSRFGYLRSPLPTGATPALQADAYACLLDYLKIDRAAIFTSSAGVTSAVQFALRHPQRLEALVFHSPNAPGPVEMTLPPEGVLKRLFRSNFAFWAMTDYLEPAMHSFVGVPKGFHLTETQRADVATTLRSVLPTSARATGMIFDTYVSNPDINNNYRLESIAAPTLVVSAVDDPMTLHVNARTLVESIPGAQLLAVPNGGHMMLGHTAEVSAAITQFLRTHMDTSGEEVIQ